MILLDKAALPGYRWGMLVRRGNGKEGGRRPCIVVVIYFKSALGLTESDDTVCGAIPRGGPPDILTYSFGSGDREVTIFALAFERRVSSVVMELGEAGTRRVNLHLINERQKRNAAVRPFRFRTFAVKGPYCLGSVTGFNTAGHAVYEAPPEEC